MAALSAELRSLLRCPGRTSAVSDQRHRDLEPLGDPDGSRADIDDILRDFVGFGGQAVYGGVAVGDEELTRTRVFVGSKGAGKSVYLRRYQAFAHDDPARYANADQLYTAPISRHLPSTDMIIRVSHWFPIEVLTETWSLMWRRAIIRSLVSHLLRMPSLTQHVPDDALRELRDDYTVLPRFRRPLSIHSQFRSIITASASRRTLSRYLDDDEWDEIEATLGSFMHDCPPIYFYVDAIDEEFAHAPIYWLQCQKGLFYEVMHLLRDPSFGGRLHIVISIRDVVYSSVLRSEHRNRYRGSPHIRLLSWNGRALQFFLGRKLSALGSQFRGRSGQDVDVAEWLGMERIHNASRRVEERIEDYLLRHTRSIPRDLVMIGNRLCHAVRAAREEGRDALSEDEVRAIIAAEAVGFGEEQLTICSNHIASDMVPVGAANARYTDFYTGETAYSEAINAQLKRFICQHIADDKLDNASFHAVAQAASEEFDGKTNLMSVLWQNGLLGYSDGDFECGDYRFYQVNHDPDHLLVPTAKPTYVLHSCLIDALGLRPIGDTPVAPRL